MPVHLKRYHGIEIDFILYSIALDIAEVVKSTSEIVIFNSKNKATPKVTPKIEYLHSLVLKIAVSSS